MKRTILSIVSAVALSFVAGAASSAPATPWPVDAPVPADLGGRTYLATSSATAYRDKLETLVGYWGVQEGDKVVVSTQRPASFATSTTPAVVKVALGKDQPVYRSILTNNRSITAAIPILNFTWGSDERGQITITETAQFQVNMLPTDADWNALPPLPAGTTKRYVYVELATLSVVNRNILKKSPGTLATLFSFLKIDGSNYRERDESRAEFVVTLGVREPLCAQLATCPTRATAANALTQAQRSRFATQLSLPLDVAANANYAAILPVSAPAPTAEYSGKSLAEILAE